MRCEQIDRLEVLAVSVSPLVRREVERVLRHFRSAGITARSFTRLAQLISEHSGAVSPSSAQRALGELFHEDLIDSGQADPSQADPSRADLSGMDNRSMPAPEVGSSDLPAAAVDAAPLSGDNSGSRAPSRSLGRRRRPVAGPLDWDDICTTCREEIEPGPVDRRRGPLFPGVGCVVKGIDWPIVNGHPKAVLACRDCWRTWHVDLWERAARLLREAGA